MSYTCIVCVALRCPGELTKDLIFNAKDKDNINTASGPTLFLLFVNNVSDILNNLAV